LKELKDLKKLETLELGNAQVTDAALAALREIGLLHALSKAAARGGARPSGPQDVLFLDLAKTPVTDAGLKELTELKNLQKLFLSDTQVTDAGVAELKKALPDCKVQR
jgi:Leucine-rich repeat (LRR) protein